MLTSRIYEDQSALMSSSEAQKSLPVCLPTNMELHRPVSAGGGGGEMTSWPIFDSYFIVSSLRVGALCIGACISLCVSM